MARILSQKQFAALAKLARKRLAGAKAAYRANDIPATMQAMREFRGAVAAMAADLSLAQMQAGKLEKKLNKLIR